MIKQLLTIHDKIIKCSRDDDPGQAYMISTIFFVSGIVTFLQTTIGCRLPIVQVSILSASHSATTRNHFQGGTFTFIAPTLSILALEQFKCDPSFNTDGWEPDEGTREEYWKVRIRKVKNFFKKDIETAFH